MLWIEIGHMGARNLPTLTVPIADYAGALDGDEVVELYVTQPRAFETPRHVLAGFTRVHLAVHTATHVSLTVDPRSLGSGGCQGKPHNRSRRVQHQSPAITAVMTAPRVEVKLS